jgi:hypothetical protein
MMFKEGAVYARTLLLQALYTSLQYCLAPEVVDPHSDADLWNALRTWVATVDVEDLKYSVSFAEPETAADAAALARLRQFASALTVEVRRLPVQSD